MILRRFATAAAGAALVTATFASPVAAAKPGSVVADHSGPQLLGDNTRTVVRGSESWLTTGWTADAAITNFSMKVVPSSDNVTVVYPDRDGNGLWDDESSSFIRTDSLAAGEIDNAAFRLDTTVRSPNRFSLEVVVSWIDAEGVAQTEVAGELEVDLTHYRGDDYEFLTDSATVFSGGDGANNWVEMDFLGASPLNNDFALTVKKGLDEVYYPQETYTSLHHDAKLDFGEEDVARIWIDPGSVTPGTYEVEITVDYVDHEGKKGKDTHSLTLTVVAAEFNG